MLDITDSKEKCFALWASTCSILTDRTKEDCSAQCRFYKPQGCEDWVRRERRGQVWIIPPEEYAEFAEKVKKSGK